MDPILLSLLLFSVGGLGFGLGFHLRRPVKSLPSHNPVLLPDSVFPSPGPSPDKVYVRFEFGDGRVEVKKFKATDLDLEVIWRGRKFAAGAWTPDGHVYTEVVS